MVGERSHAVEGNTNQETADGPEGDKSREIPKPTTTGGRAINDDDNAMTPRRPQKRPIDNAVPKGIANIAAISVAVREIRNDRPTMPHKVASPVVISCNVVLKISKIGLSVPWLLLLGLNCES